MVGIHGSVTLRRARVGDAAAVLSYRRPPPVSEWMERVGMRREGRTLKDALHPSGKWTDGYRCELLAEEWHRRHSSSWGRICPS